MEKKRLRNWLLAFSALFLAFYGCVFAFVLADRNYAPGSIWPDVFNWSGGISLLVLALGWAYWWFKK